MSRYRLEIDVSRYRYGLESGIFLLLVLSTLAWQPNLMDHQLLIQICLIVMLLVIAAIRLYALKQRSLCYAVSLSAKGDWQYLTDIQQPFGAANIAWRISDRSRVTSLMLWVNLVPAHAYLKISDKWIWVFRDQLDEADYRRLARIIIRKQKGVA